MKELEIPKGKGYVSLDLPEEITITINSGSGIQGDLRVNSIGFRDGQIIVRKWKEDLE